MAECMIEIRIDDKELKRYLEALSGIDLRPLMRNLACMMYNAVRKNFEAEGRPRWSPLSDKTIKEREKRGYWPGKILQMRGSLVSSISMAYSRNEAVVGTNKKYAAIHQFGGQAGRRKKVNIPARPYLKLIDDDLNDIKNTVIEYLRRGNVNNLSTR